MASGLDTIGVIARSVADCALVVGAVSGRDFGDPARQAERAPRIGVCRTAAWSSAAPETVALIENAAARLARAGATVADVDLPAVFERAATLHPVIMNNESGRALGWELMHHRDQVSPDLRERLDWGLAQPAALLDEANATFAAARLAFPVAMAGYDVLLTPSATGEAPRGLGWTGDPVFNSLWTGLHVPCVTVPAGVGPNGLPLGLQLVGRAGDDAAVLHWAAWVAAQL
jgi:Asp-tRNA(Asn)/Glu-tRNA(Gln) amidotransferase A subunit family amidase